MSSVLGIGVATLDIVLSVDHYPEEDEKFRAQYRRVNRGGNVTNTLSILSRLGHQCFWGGTLADDLEANHIKEDLDRHLINRQFCKKIADGSTPTSYILNNRLTNSRTITHYRDLPEYHFEDFLNHDFNEINWIHFEGRNCLETANMQAYIRENHPEITLSVEIEKPRPGIESLFLNADLLIFSRSYIESTPTPDAESFSFILRKKLPGVDFVCPWGDKGAYALSRNGQFTHSRAFTPETVIDTIGAGDTFIAGIIDATLRGLDLEKATSFACRIAGEKCGHEGLDFPVDQAIHDEISGKRV
ncbi:MAG: PfkB family carbohydrate kinase [Gammaproteobacteria bacterium]